VPTGPATPQMVRYVTEALLGLVEKAVDPDGTIGVSVVAAPPDVVSKTVSGQIVSLYLYRVVESPELKNQGPHYEIDPDDDQRVRVRMDPLSLNLHYLLIPFSFQMDSYMETYDLLSKAMLALHDSAIFAPGALGVVPPPEPGEPPEEALEYRVTPEPLTVSELGQIWEAVHEPYRLSVSYVVRTVQIRSRDVGGPGGRVTTRRFGVEQKRES
jgi:hypothetical protein